MPRALVVHSDVLSRNLVRLALERRGLTVEVVPNVGALAGQEGLARFAAAFVSARDCEPEPVDVALGRLRDRGLRGAIVVSSSDPTLASERADWFVDEPLDRRDVEEAADRLVEATFTGRDAVDVAWNGALRHERKQLARELPGRLADLRATVAEARRGRAPDRLERASRAAGALAADAMRFRFTGVGEVCAEIRSVLERMRDGRVDPASVAAWARLSALCRLLDDPPVTRALAQQTVDDAQLRRSRARVLVLHPDLALLLAAAAVSERNGIALVTAREADEGRRQLRVRRFDVIYVAEALPGGATADLLRAIRTIPGHAAVPIVLLADDERPDALARALATEVIQLPLRERAFLGALDRVLPDPGRILWVGEDGATRRMVAGALTLEPVELLHATGGAADAAVAHAPDLVVVDGSEDLARALAAVRELRETRGCARLPVYLLAADESEPTRVVAAACGVDGVIAATSDCATVRAVLAGRLQRCRGLDRRDASGLVSARPVFLRQLAGMLVGGAAVGRPVSLGIVYLAQLVDTEGRAGFSAGERLVDEVATALVELAGDVRLVGRLAEDRLAIATEVQAEHLAASLARTCRRLADLPWIDALSTEGELLALGVAEAGSQTDPAALIAAATRAVGPVGKASRHVPWLRRVLARSA
jgi:DNA-binding response OmpR family regulator